jgi:hypothetical protein
MSGQLHAPAAFPRGKNPRYPLDRRLGETQSRSGHGSKEKKSQPLLAIELGRSARSLVTVLCELTHLLSCSSLVQKVNLRLQLSDRLHAHRYVGEVAAPNGRCGNLKLYSLLPNSSLVAFMVLEYFKSSVILTSRCQQNHTNRHHRSSE